jgi:deoxyribodipyrimidine photolyase
MTKQHWSKDCAAAKQERDKLKHQVEELEKQLANYVPQFCVTESTQLKQFVKEAYDELGSYYCNIEAVRKKLKDAIQQ